LVCLCFVVSCNKNSNSQQAKVKYLNYQSPIKYQYGQIADKTQVAMVADTPVSWEQLMSQDVALKELQDTYNEKAVAFAYAWANSMLDGEAKG
jgi:hypothetical protein